MGRSVSYPTGSVVAFRLLDDGEDEDIDWVYECLVDEVIDAAKAAFPSFERFNGWRGREDRILLRNAFADCGISTYCGLAAKPACLPSSRCARLRQHSIATRPVPRGSPFPARARAIRETLPRP